MVSLFDSVRLSMVGVTIFDDGIVFAHCGNCGCFEWEHAGIACPYSSTKFQVGNDGSILYYPAPEDAGNNWMLIGGKPTVLHTYKSRITRKWVLDGAGLYASKDQRVRLVDGPVWETLIWLNFLIRTSGTNLSGLVAT